MITSFLAETMPVFLEFLVWIVRLTKGRGHSNEELLFENYKKTL